MLSLSQYYLNGAIFVTIKQRWLPLSGGIYLGVEATERNDKFGGSRRRRKQEDLSASWTLSMAKQFRRTKSSGERSL